jgi:hypothetical protein
LPIAWSAIGEIVVVLCRSPQHVEIRVPLVDSPTAQVFKFWSALTHFRLLSGHATSSAFTFPGSGLTRAFGSGSLEKFILLSLGLKGFVLFLVVG